MSFVCLSVSCLFVIVINITCICSDDQLWWRIPSDSLPLYCFSLQLLFFIVVNKISIYLGPIYLFIYLSSEKPRSSQYECNWNVNKSHKCIVSVRLRPILMTRPYTVRRAAGRWLQHNHRPTHTRTQHINHIAWTGCCRRERRHT